MADYWWAVWISVGVVLLIIELIATSFYLLWAGAAAIIAGIAAKLVPEAEWLPWVVFAVAGVILLFFTRRYASKLHGAALVPSNVDAMIGRRGRVVEAIDPAANRGRVRIESEEWRARAREFIAEGTLVQVLSIQGATVMVKPWEATTDSEATATGAQE